MFVGGQNPSVKAVESAVRELAQSDVPVLVLGEVGSGKRTVARRIHDSSPRCREPFRVAACASLSLEEFSSSVQSLFDTGTLFLEEISDLNSVSQAGLLQMLSIAENGNGKRRARLICGSTRDLEAEVRSGKVREDLYYRVSGVCLRLPPLRQRKEDIPTLVNFFLAKYAKAFQREIPALSEESQRLFQDYSWPGNIRELEDAIRAIAALGDETVAMGGLRALLTRSERVTGERVSLKETAKAASREAEKQLILQVLTRTRWNRRRAAQELQISYKALLYKLKQIGYGEYGAS